MDHQLQYMILKRDIFLHCVDTGIDYYDFWDIWAEYINEDPAVFDIFFEYPYDQITEMSKDARVDLLIDVCTLD